MSFVATSLRISSGIVIWALHFGVIYGFTALACARGSPGAVPWVIGIATVVAATLAIGIMFAGFRRRGHFESWLSAGIASFALIAIVYEAMPLFTVPLCT